jgi:outer membrane protein OmpA-like peptidoglycan-associated protein
MHTPINLLLILLFFLAGLTASAQENTSRLVRVDSVCSDMDDKAPFIHPVDHSIYFSRTNANRDLDVWRADWTGNSWAQPRPVSAPFNNILDNEIYHIDSSTGSVYFQKGIINESGDGPQYGIFRCHKTSSGWSEPIKQKIRYFKNKSKDQSFCISKDGNILILSMEGYTTYGVEDLYVSFRESDDVWSEPQNLGTSVNTKYEEFTPFLDTDNRTLYFSSNGHQGGYGSKDIWVSYRLDETWKNWSKPKNLGPQINTIGMETSFRKLNLKPMPFLVASTRTSNGMSDIFAVRIEQAFLDSLIAPFILSTISKTDPDTSVVTTDSVKTDVNPVDSINSPLVGSNINYLKLEVFNKSTNRLIKASAEISSRNLNDTIIIPKDSIISIEFDWLDTVHLHIKSENFLPQSRRVIFENRRFGLRLKEEFYLDSLEPGKNIKLENVLFKRGTPELLESSFENLDFVVEILYQHPDFDIEISGHTDNSGNAYLNHLLSEKRANTIKKYLVDKGVEGQRIATKGYGGSKPIASNDSEETMKLNRRVEFKLIEKIPVDKN